MRHHCIYVCLCSTTFFGSCFDVCCFCLGFWWATTPIVERRRVVIDEDGGRNLLPVLSLYGFPPLSRQAASPFGVQREGKIAV